MTTKILHNNGEKEITPGNIVPDRLLFAQPVELRDDGSTILILYQDRNMIDVRTLGVRKYNIQKRLKNSDKKYKTSIGSG